MKPNEIRQSFLDFFVSKGHHIVSSCSLLPEAPNLLFTNAGMNPFVPYFLGERKPTYSRVADTQKCIRAGGKHNDLEEVGFDTYHHTFFEMLGNWSFGDFFKKEAIQWAWELLTKVWGLPKERLYATVYKPECGDPAQFDQEAYDIWKQIFLHEGLDYQTHIVFGNKKDNFWMMGDTGPCGPCSEIHMDLTPEGNTEGQLVNQGSVRCIEIWNLVFMQYNALPNGQFELLKDKYVDTGMGFERIAGIFETTNNFKDFSKLPSNYDSDLFTPIFNWLQEKSGHIYGGKIANADEKTPSHDILLDCSFRIIADHIRTLSFAIADGILPGNESRNYVLRRIIRRAILFGQKLNLPCGFFSELSSVVVHTMGHFFPELVQNADIIKKVLKKEEETFQITLSRGLRLFEKWAEENPKQLSGDKAFLLYDTYGFPIDLTQLIAKEHGMELDLHGFESAMSQQKERSKAASKKSIVQLADNSASATHFVGYLSKNLSHWKATIKAVHTYNKHIYIETDTSPFYGEKGGQAGDTGSFTLASGQTIEIANTIWLQQILLHEIKNITLENAQTFINSPIIMHVNIERRKAIARHHTATHLLHWALRKVLGNHVHQAGSSVTENALRFDFSHFEKISQEQLQTVEHLCNEKILDNLPIHTDEVDFDERPAECLAFFEEKYGDRVRVVHIGDYSVELCGGTHASATGELGQLKILQETSIASGVRRIEAIAGWAAYQYHQDILQKCQQLESHLGCPLEKISEKYQALEVSKKIIDDLYRKNLQKNMKSSVAKTTEVQGLTCIQMQMQIVDANTLRILCKTYFTENTPDILLAASEFEGKGIVLVFCSENAISKGMAANTILQNLLKPLNAHGGGKPDFATGGVKDLTALKNTWNDLTLNF